MRKLINLLQFLTWTTSIISSVTIEHKDMKENTKRNIWWWQIHRNTCFSFCLVHVCVCLEYFRIIRPYLSRDLCSMESPRKTHLLLFTIRKKGKTLGHVPITQFKEAKVFASKLDCIWCWQIDCRLLLINYVWSQSSWDIRQPILEEVANISQKGQICWPIVKYWYQYGAWGPAFLLFSCQPAFLFRFKSPDVPNPRWPYSTNVDPIAKHEPSAFALFGFATLPTIISHQRKTTPVWLHQTRWFCHFPSDSPWYSN